MDLQRPSNRYNLNSEILPWLSADSQLLPHSHRLDSAQMRSRQHPINHTKLRPNHITTNKHPSTNSTTKTHTKDVDAEVEAAVEDEVDEAGEDADNRITTRQHPKMPDRPKHTTTLSILLVEDFMVNSETGHPIL